jgi:hypothetical protein
MSTFSRDGLQCPKPRFPELTSAQLKSLEEYSVQHGRNWKACLRNDWENGRSYGELQQIRNTFGPTWLVRFSFPDGGAA